MDDFFFEEDVIFACQISGIYDRNRNQTLENNDYSLLKDWCISIIKLNLTGIIFHNNYSDLFCQEHTNNNIKFIKIDFNANFNPNVYRYIIYEQYLDKFKKLKNIFLTDISDVVLVQNPFTSTYYKENSNVIFCGDEPKLLENDWMIDHCTFLRNNIANFIEFEEKFKDATLLNCGIIGGNIGLIKEVIKKLATIHSTYNFNNTTDFTGDMGAFNYLIRTEFNSKVLHGFPINTQFKLYEEHRSDCWFRHK